MRGLRWAMLACLVVSPRLYGDDDAKKWLVGRWAPGAPEKKAAPGKGSKSKSKAKAKGKATKPADELPKCILEFTEDGKVRLDGDPSTLGGNLRFLKPLSDFPMRVSPETRGIQITYAFTGDNAIEVSADHTWLLEKLSAGGEPPTPEKAKELLKQYRPRETLTVAATAKQLTLTNEDGQALSFRRYAGGSLLEEEGRRSAEALRQGMAPLNDFLRQQGINTGAPADGPPPGKAKSSRTKKGRKPQ